MNGRAGNLPDQPPYSRQQEGRMGFSVERLLPVLADSGTWIFGALVVAAVLGVWALGRGQRFFVPAGWRGRILSLAFVALGIVSAMLLYCVTGPMAPMLGQVRQVRSVVSKPAPELTYQVVADNSPHRLSELRGKVVVLNLWATWCGPCRHELPDIDRLQKTYADQGVVVVTLSTEERQDLLKFAEQFPYSTLNVYAPHFAWVDVGGRPLSYVIDREGKVRACFIGARTYADFEREVRECLGSHSRV